MAEEATSTDCRSEDGITVGLIDGMIAAARVVAQRNPSAPAVQEALKDLRSDADVAKVMGTGGVDPLKYVPGSFRCPKCDFRLAQFTFSAVDASIGDRDEVGEKCPNCNVPLWRVSWRDEALEYLEIAERLRAEMPNPAGEKIRIGAGEGMESEPVTGQPPVGSDPDCIAFYMVDEATGAKTTLRWGKPCQATVRWARANGMQFRFLQQLDASIPAVNVRVGGKPAMALQNVAESLALRPVELRGLFKSGATERADPVETYGEIERLRSQQVFLRDQVERACDLLAERTYGSPARSPGHNARVVLEAALKGGRDG